MALEKCRECGAQVSTKADACPGCGAARNRPGFLLQLVRAVGLLMLILFGITFCVAWQNGGSLQNPMPARKPLVSQEEQAAAILLNLPRAWSYSTAPDEMTGKTSEFAAIDSETVVDFPFPYQGAQRASLTLRKHPRWGKDVYISLSKAHFDCSSIDGCSVLVRFDDGPPVKFSASAPEASNTNLLFIRGYDRFVSRVAKAKVTRIEAQFYQQGNRSFEFKTEGLQWGETSKAK